MIWQLLYQYTSEWGWNNWYWLIALIGLLMILKKIEKNHRHPNYSDSSNNAVSKQLDGY